MRLVIFGDHSWCWRCLRCRLRVVWVRGLGVPWPQLFCGTPLLPQTLSLGLPATPATPSQKHKQKRLLCSVTAHPGQGKHQQSML